MKIVYLAYREWALKVFPYLKKHPKINESILIKTINDLNLVDVSDYDLLVSCGWSDELSKEISSNITAIGVHCAELDRYSYGTPLQLQILDGITRTKHRIFSFTFEENSKRAHTHNRLFSHEVDLDLSGNMADILEQMTSTSIVLFNRFFDDYPNIIWHAWPEEEEIRNKRNPEDSCLTKNDIQNMNTEQLYNFFRCLEDPYPNGYIQDDKGKLIIKKVEFKKK